MGGALEARHVTASKGHLSGEARGEVETESGVLVLRRIHVVYHLSAPAEARPVAERVHGFHARQCPVYRSLSPAIEITTELILEPSQAADL